MGRPPPGRETAFYFLFLDGFKMSEFAGGAADAGGSCDGRGCDITGLDKRGTDEPGVAREYLGGISGVVAGWQQGCCFWEE